MDKGNITYRPISLGFWKAYWIQMRPYLLFLSGIAGMTGVVVATSPGDQPAGIALIPFFLAYGFGQALTDCYQTDTDALSAPYRPLSRGEISVGDVRLVSLFGLLLCGSILIVLNPLNIVFSVLTIVGLGTYTFFKKRFWWAGPFYNAWIVALLPVMGYLCQGSNLQEMPVLLPVLTFFSYANFVLMGYLKDISADRTTGYNTFSVKFGWDATLWVGNLFVLISSGICFLIVNNEISHLLLVAATVIAVSGQLYGHFVRIKKEEHAAYPIISTVRSIILWHLAVLLSYQPDLVWASLFYYLFFELFLFKRPSHSQI